MPKTSITRNCNHEECYDLVLSSKSDLTRRTKGFIFKPFRLKDTEDFEDTITYDYLRGSIPKIIRYYGTLKVIVKPGDPAYLVSTLVQYCANNYIDLILFHAIGKYGNIYMKQYFKNVK